MKVTKFGHSCLLVEVDGVRIMTDLGTWNPEVPDVSGLHAMLITHEHGDHFELEKLKVLLGKNPEAKVITHAAVGEKLQEAGIAFVSIEPRESVEVNGVSIESYGTDHAIIYGDKAPCRNTGYLIAGRLFIPGDALHDVPAKPVEILALPIGGPWMKVSEAIDYAKKLAPKSSFPIHDAMYTPDYKHSVASRWFAPQLEAAGIKFVNLGDGASAEF